MRDKLDKLIAESMAIEAEDAKQAGTVGFIKSSARDPGVRAGEG